MASTQVSSKIKTELAAACEEANKELEGREARRVTIHVCRELAFLGPGRSEQAKERAFKACWAIAGKK